MKTAEIRQAFFKFFEERGHTLVASSSLVPTNDPTILFTNAGMNQFKNCFLGVESRPYKRAVSCQKCVRVSGKHNDLENVGVTARHHTFFEMLGNFSFGDYFKADAIKFGWEFVTQVLGLPESKLWVTIYEKDDEAAKLWRELTGIRPERVIGMGEKDNFWAMGETGPCGPCSEIHVYRGVDDSKQSEQLLRSDDGSFVEIWNLVFMQFNRSADGGMALLPKPSVDTGMGLERVAAIKQGVFSNYDTDLLRGVITLCEELSGLRYDGSSYQARDLRTDRQYARDVAMRVIADHSRAIAFIIADGVLPGSEGRGYVLRRIIRRAVRHGRVLDFKEPFLAKTTARVVAMMSGQYPELEERSEAIARIVDGEERKFHETLDTGLNILQREVEKAGSSRLFPGKTAFLLHDTYGFPLDLTEDVLKAYGLKVNVEEFEQEMERQRQRSREDRKAQALTYDALSIKGEKTRFVGYDTLKSEGRLLQIVNREEALNEGSQRIWLIFDVTPFYGESGGQIGDTGSIRFKDVVLKVLDTQKVQDGYHVHECQVAEGCFSTKLVGERAELSVDVERRTRIRAHHSSTHLLHAALRNVLGRHVKQAGSQVDDRMLRFDYSHFEPVSEAQLAEVQSFVNNEIRLNHEVVTRELPLEEAQKLGAMALFGEKYGELVRVVQMGPRSLELCGGTHVSRTGDIGLMLVSSETGIAAGVRRITCLAGERAYQQLMLEREERSQIAGLLKSDLDGLPEKIGKLLLRVRNLERELEIAKARLASAASGGLTGNARLSPQGIKVIAELVEAHDVETLRSMVDRLRQALGSGVVALGSIQGDKGLIITGVTPDLAGRVNAGALIKEAANLAGGRGGGRADFAQAGGLDSSKLNASLNKIFELVP